MNNIVKFLKNRNKHLGMQWIVLGICGVIFILFYVFPNIASADYIEPVCDEISYWYCDNATDCNALTGDFEWTDFNCISLDFTAHSTELDALNDIAESSLILRSYAESSLNLFLFVGLFGLMFLFVLLFISIIYFIRHFLNPKKLI